MNPFQYFDFAAAQWVAFGLFLYGAMKCRGWEEHRLFHPFEDKWQAWLNRFPKIKQWLDVPHVSLVHVLWHEPAAGFKHRIWKLFKYNPGLPPPFSPFTDDPWHHVKKWEFVFIAAAVWVWSLRWEVFVATYAGLNVFFYWHYARTVPVKDKGAWMPLVDWLMFWSRK